MSTDPLADVLQRMAASGVAARPDLVGCTEAEIAALEHRYALRLPKTYRRYLEVMGHRSGKLFMHDHMAVFYPYVLTLTEEWRAQLAGSPARYRFTLPPDRFVIADRLSDQIQFIRCSGQEDSPVWHYSIDTCVVKECGPSVVEWLDECCRMAEDAIRSGYFETYPEGTVP